ncbi:TadE/TadG family type IV pilus assembly protein [Amycolatopsis sp. La24]|uniref:TadE/TadG family type IV pilus assembly protein n=1 Tax=Amycolatopsis sp. La24 TaxID=3028304 RepID=UPI0023AEF937|nr:TadE/TadG family type IV pilus assembly protein [Amycolatopsis sp. La24]
MNTADCGTLDSPRCGGDEGSVSVEVAVLLLVVVAVGLLIVAGARVGSAQQAVDDAATAAARAASIARGSAAESAGENAARARLRSAGVACADVSVVVEVTSMAPGHVGTTRARVACSVRLSDLALPLPVGARIVTSTFGSPVDPYRGIQ